MEFLVFDKFEYLEVSRDRNLLFLTFSGLFMSLIGFGGRMDNFVVGDFALYLSRVTLADFFFSETHF